MQHYYISSHLLLFYVLQTTNKKNKSPIMRISLNLIYINFLVSTNVFKIIFVLYYIMDEKIDIKGLNDDEVKN